MQRILWKEAQNYINTNQLHLLARNDDQNEIYKKDMDIIKQKYKSISDYILHNMLNYDTITENNKLVAITDTENINTGNQLIMLVPNHYPYYFEPTITQYVLWSNKEIDENNIKTIIEDKLTYILNKSEPKYNEDYMYWINPVELKSVLDVWHAHIIIKK